MKSIENTIKNLYSIHAKTKHLTSTNIYSIHSSKKAQSALEYMMTYGWAILVIVIVAVILYSMGIFNPSSNITSGYTGFVNMPVLAQDCISNVGLFIYVGNSVGHTITITTINVTLQNGSTVSDNLLLTVRPGEDTLIPFLGACPSNTNKNYHIAVTVKYYLTESTLREIGFAKGVLYGTVAQSINNAPSAIKSLFSVSYAFGTPYIGVPFQTQEYYAKGIFIGKVASAFPSSLSDLNNGYVQCGEPYNSQGYTAVSDIYLTNGSKFEILTNDGTAVFYRSISGGQWTSVFGSQAWHGNSAGHYGPTAVNLASGEYEVAVDWTNICSGGISAIDIEGGLPYSDYWNVSAWTPLDNKVDLLSYQNVTSNPADPANISIEQIGNWSSKLSANNCNSENFCTTIFDAFDLPANTMWWVDYDGSNVTSKSTFISFTVSNGDHTYQLAEPTVNSSGCVEKYTTTTSGTIASGSSLPIFYGQSETCYTVINESNLPNDVQWSASVNGVQETAYSPNDIVFKNNHGSYSISIPDVTYSGTTYYPCPSSGYIAAGTHLQVDFSTSSCGYGLATFSESGIPYGLNWSVDYNGNLKATNSSAITFVTPSGSHSFTVEYPTLTFLHTGCIINYTPSSATGTLSTGDSGTISFSPLYNCTSEFIAHGLPAGAQWDVNYSGVLKSSSLDNINFSTSLETTNFNALAVSYGGKEYYPCPIKGTLPSGSQQDIYYSTTQACQQ